MTAVKVTLVLPVREGVSTERAKAAAIEAGNLLMSRIGDFERTMIDQALTWQVEEVRVQ